MDSTGFLAVMFLLIDSLAIACLVNLFLQRCELGKRVAAVKAREKHLLAEEKLEHETHLKLQERMLSVLKVSKRELLQLEREKSDQAIELANLRWELASTHRKMEDLQRAPIGSRMKEYVRRQKFGMSIEDALKLNAKNAMDAKEAIKEKYEAALYAASRHLEQSKILELSEQVARQDLLKCQRERDYLKAQLELTSRLYEGEREAEARHSKAVQQELKWFEIDRSHNAEKLLKVQKELREMEKERTNAINREKAGRKMVKSAEKKIKAIEHLEKARDDAMVAYRTVSQQLANNNTANIKSDLKFKEIQSLREQDQYQLQLLTGRIEELTKSLESQVASTTQAEALGQKMEEEMEEMEKTAAAAQEKLVEEMAVLKRQLSENAMQANNTNDTRETSEAALSQALTDVTTAQQMLREKEQQLQQRERQLQERDSHLQESNQKLAEAHLVSAQALVERNALQSHLDASHAEHENTRAALAQAQADRQNALGQTIGSDIIKAAEAQYASLEKELAKALAVRQEMELEMELKYQTIQDEVEELKASKKSLEQDLSAAKGEVESLQSGKLAIQGELWIAKQTAAKVTEATEAERFVKEQLKRTKLNKTVVESERAALQTDLAKLQHEMDDFKLSYTDLAKGYETVSIDLKCVLESAMKYYHIDLSPQNDYGRQTGMTPPPPLRYDSPPRPRSRQESSSAYFFGTPTGGTGEPIAQSIEHPNFGDLNNVDWDTCLDPALLQSDPATLMGPPGSFRQSRARTPIADGDPFEYEGGTEDAEGETDSEVNGIDSLEDRLANMDVEL